MKTFEEHLNAVIDRARTPKRSLAAGECQSPPGHRCVLCYAIDLTYETELALKNEALPSYWEQHFPPGLLSEIVPSPMGRGYRTVTKRRAFHVGESVRLGLIAPTEQGSYKPFDVLRCAIEPDGHAPIFRKVQEILEKPYAAPLAEALSYVIIKGSYAEYTLILNVRHGTADVVRAANTLSRSLTHSFKEIVAVFLFQDTSDGRYYLGSSRHQGSAFRRVFGKAEIFQKICGRKFLYPPASFSQVNMSIIDRFVVSAAEMLGLDSSTRLIDLYCGYGLFALSLADRVRSVTGIEMSAESIEAAIANAQRLRIPNTRFLRSEITAESLHRALKSSRGNDAVLLDPPRNGTDEGVIEYIAARRPARVLHIFCNTDIMPAELKRWTDNGYTISTATPFDMFPGTPALEVMVLLTPTAS